MGKYEADIRRGDRDSHGLVIDLVGSGRTVLDLGCADGALDRVLREQGCQVSGVEYDEESARTAKEVLERLVIADLDEVDLVAEFGAAAFDVVVCADVLEHVKNPGRLLAQVHDVLGPRGAVVASIPNIAHGDVRLALMQGRWEYRPLGLLDDTHLRFFTLASIHDLFTRCGLTIAEIQRTERPLFGTELGLRQEDFSPAVVQAVDNAPESYTYQFVVRAFKDAVDGTLGMLRRTVDEQHAQIDGLHGQLAALESERSALRAETARLQNELARARQEAHRAGEAAAEAAAFRETRTYRWTTTARNTYGRLRGSSS